MILSISLIDNKEVFVLSQISEINFSEAVGKHCINSRYSSQFANKNRFFTRYSDFLDIFFVPLRQNRHLDSSMKNIDSRLIVFFFVFLRFFPIKAQVLSEKDFQVLNVNDGLSDNDIHSVAKDTEGFMWFGTGGGLNRYDGRTFKIFRISESSYRRIDKVVSLNRDYLLIRSEQNLFLFNKKYERFLPVCDSVKQATYYVL